MKYKTGKIIKILAFLIGFLGIFEGFMIAYNRHNPLSSSLDSNKFIFALYLQFLVSYGQYLIILALILYAIGHIIEILQSISDTLSLPLHHNKEEQDTNAWSRPNDKDSSINASSHPDDEDRIVNSNAWSRPEDKDSNINAWSRPNDEDSIRKNSNTGGLI